MFQVGQFVQLCLQFDSIIQAIRRTVWPANSCVECIQLQLNMFSLGHFSPSVITPRHLRGLLLEIENHLPDCLKLPYDPKGEIWKLLQTLLTYTTVLDEDRYWVISMVAWYRLETSSIAVNLAEMKYVFDSYRTGTLYIPFTTLFSCQKPHIFHDF